MGTKMSSLVRINEIWNTKGINNGLREISCGMLPRKASISSVKELIMIGACRVGPTVRGRDQDN